MSTSADAVCSVVGIILSGFVVFLSARMWRRVRHFRKRKAVILARRRALQDQMAASYREWQREFRAGDYESAAATQERRDLIDSAIRGTFDDMQAELDALSLF